MIKSTARREAEEFARVIDGPTSTGVADRYAELTRTVTLLREHPRPTPRPEFVLDLRERLMAAADTELVPATPRTVTPIQRPGKGRRRLATVAAAAVIVGGTTGVAVAAQGALPGDTLYPVKRGLESIQVTLDTSDSARGRELLAQAATRLQEAQDLLAQPRTSQRDRLLGSTLAAAAENANSGADLLFSNYQRTRSGDDIADVRDFATHQMDVLGDIADSGSARRQLGQLGDALAAIDQQARVLCAGCSSLPDATLPKNVLGLSASQTTLASLVSAPTVRAGQLEELAQRAQTVADHAPAGPHATTTLHNDDSAAPDSDISSTHNDDATDSGDHTDTTGKVDSTDKTQPVKDLLNGLTDDSDSSLPGQLSSTVNGVTTGLGDVLGGAADTVGGLLGGTSK